MNNKKIIIPIFFIILIFLIYPSISLSKTDYREEYDTAINKYYELLAIARSSGYNTTEAEALREQAKVTEQGGFYRAALILMEHAIKLLEEKLEGKPDFVLPTKTPVPSVKPTQYPISTKKPLQTSTPTWRPTQTPEATEKPALVPTQTPKATEKPALVPTQTPEATEKPAFVPTQTPEATEKPAFVPTQTPEATEKPALVPTQTPGHQDIYTPTPETLSNSFERNEGYPFGINTAHQPIFNELLPYYKKTNAKWILINGLVWAKRKPPDWTKIDEQVNLLYNNGFSVIMEINILPTSDGTASEFPSDIEDYSKFIFRSVARYDGDGDYNNDGIIDGPPMPKINYWKILNEPDLNRFWADTPANYAKVVKLSAENAHKANPMAKIIFGGISNKNTILGEKINTGFLENLFKFTFPDGKKVQDYLDYMSFHYHGNSKGFSDFMEAQTGIMKKYNVKKPFMITELGCPGGVNFSFEDGNFLSAPLNNQAIEIVKMHTLAFSLGAEKVFYYSISDQKKQLKESSNDTIFVSEESVENIYLHDLLSYYGLFYFDFEPKPSMACYKFMAEKLKNRKVSHEILGLAEGVRCFVFIKNKKFSTTTDEPLYIIWNETGEKQISMKLPWKKANLSSFILIKGDEVYTSELEATTNGTFDIHLVKEPILLEFSP